MKSLSNNNIISGLRKRKVFGLLINNIYISFILISCGGDKLEFS